MVLMKVNMNRALDPEKKKGLIIISMIALLLVCVFVAEKYRGLCVSSIVLVGGNLVVDVLYGVIDPRIRLD